ncbi:hypothetical protein [Oceanicoccus sp. KOV_DT_Chl]|uniref:hypothetical protein n=1 Tax=Oceanicoccus sp. KOV_DT_Chl TaxID=1904639 RepID=UPI000C795F8C|nr:hypothetical protein [Oceanicoccus sp. KOV_DT_Chl]
MINNITPFISVSTNLLFVFGFIINSAAATSLSEYNFFDVTSVNRSVDEFPVESMMGVSADLDMDGIRFRAGTTINDQWIVDAQYLKM